MTQHQPRFADVVQRLASLAVVEATQLDAEPPTLLVAIEGLDAAAHAAIGFDAGDVRSGDTVVVITVASGEHIAIARVRSHPVEPAPLRIEQRGGRTVLAARDGGDLELAAPTGRVQIAARDGVELRGARVAVCANAPDAPERGESLLVTPGQVQVETGTLRVSATQVTARAERAESDVGTYTLRAQRLAQTIGHWEVRATRILERARDVYRDASEHMQLRSGSFRAVAKETMHWVARRAVVKADDDVKVRAEKIYLG